MSISNEMAVRIPYSTAGKQTQERAGRGNKNIISIYYNFYVAVCSHRFDVKI